MCADGNKKIAVAVGTTIADRHPHRSVQARLRIRLLPWMSGGECLPHTVQSLGHAFPALCRAHVRLSDVLLSLRPSLPGRAAQVPVQTASGRFGGDVVEGRPACGEDTSVSA
jgi:hypothetical protein